MQEQILMGYQYPYSWLGDLEYVQMMPRLDNLFQGIFLLFFILLETQLSQDFLP